MGFQVSKKHIAKPIWLSFSLSKKQKKRKKNEKRKKRGHVSFNSKLIQSLNIRVLSSFCIVLVHSINAIVKAEKMRTIYPGKLHFCFLSVAKNYIKEED